MLYKRCDTPQCSLPCISQNCSKAELDLVKYICSIKKGHDRAELFALSHVWPDCEIMRSCRIRLSCCEIMRNILTSQLSWKDFDKFSPWLSWRNCEFQEVSCVINIHNIHGQLAWVMNVSNSLYPVYTGGINRFRVGFCFKPLVRLIGFRCVYTTCLNWLLYNYCVIVYIIDF